jgi:hypothetical protein
MSPPAARARRRGFLAAAALAVACSHGPTYEQLSRQQAGPRPGYARIFVYTPLRSEALGFHPEITLDGERVGTSSPGTFFYVDRQPGVYELDIPSKRSAGAFGSAVASDPARVSVWLGRAAFVQVDVVEFGNTVQTRLRTREREEGEPLIRACRYAAPLGAPRD